MNGIIDPSISYQQYQQERQQHLPLQQHQQQQQQQQNNNNILHTQPQPYRSINSLNNNGIPNRQSPLHPSSKLYSQPQQIFNSEWLEDLSPNNSPSKLSKILESEYKMSSTITTTQPTKYQTPLKTSQSANFPYVTPISHQKIDIHEEINSIIPSQQQQQQSKIIPTKIPSISNWTIFSSMLNDLVGKDKLAKVSQYTLRLLVYHATKSQNYLSDDQINIKSINERYNNHEKKLDLIKNFLKHPTDFIKIITILVLSLFKQKVAGMITGLSTYRQFLRFGKTPFRLRDLIVKFKQNIILKNSKFEINKSNLFNRKTLGQFFSLYYGINDESTLLYKLNVLSDPTYKKFASRHESYAWYCETWLALYNAYENLQNLIQQEMDIKIQIQVKNKAKQLSKQLLGGGNSLINLSSSSSSTNNSEDVKLLDEIQFKKNNAWIDIYKNLSDLAFNSYTVFQIKLPFDTWQIWMGISASVLSTIKLYRETKRSMIEKEMAKLKSE